MPRPTVCLNMIVKDEAHVIQRCLESVRPLIDSWCIVDTGSSDGTQELIRTSLADLPGSLHERPWRNFAHNRNEALKLACELADYLLFIDADDVLEFSPDFARPHLTQDAYELEIRFGELDYRRVSLVATRLAWRWVGVLHEHLDCDRAFSRGVLPGVTMRIVGGGGRSRVDAREKFARDAAVLEAALRDDPDNARYQFYLAQSYRDSLQWERALEAYDRRAQMGGFAEEVFCARLQAARAAEKVGRSDDEIVTRLLRAHETRPTRAEALGELARFLREQGERWSLAWLFARQAASTRPPEDVLFVEREWYEWRALDEYSIAAYWVGDYAASRDACTELLERRPLPDAQRGRVEANLRFAESKTKSG